MDVKLFSVRILDILFFLYFFLLSFIRFGIGVGHYTFSIPDIVLVLIFIIYAFKLFNKFNISKVSKKFIVLYIIFFAGISLSLIGIKDIKIAFLELLAYFYGFSVIFIFSVYLSERKEKGLKIIFYSAVFTLLIIFLSSLLLFTNLKLKNIMLFKWWNYVFFVSMPNQLAIFLIICFNIYLIGRKYIDNLKIWTNIINVILPLLFFFSVILTGSRTGFVISFILVVYSYFIEFKKLKSIRKIILFLVILLILSGLFSVMFYKTEHPSLLFKRAINVYNNIKACSFTKGDVREENFNDAIKAFLTRPINGVGLGNIWKNYSKWEIHSSYLSILSEAGIIGFVPFIILLGYILYFIIRYNRKLEYFVVYFSVLLYSMQHHILRERWTWLFFIYLLIYMHFKKKTLASTISIKNI